MKSFAHSISALAVAIAVGGCGPGGTPAQSDSTHSTPPDSPAPNVDPDENSSLSAPGFVRAFYDWYVPIARSDVSAPAWFAVLQRDPPVLNAKLLSALRKDSISGAASPGEVNGLDFDPFLDSQDPCEAYELGSVTGVGNSQHVAIHSVCSGSRSPEPSLLAEVVMEDGSWVFQNVRYARMKSDLINVLTELNR